MFPTTFWLSSLLRTMPKSRVYYYAVKKGRVPGVYNTWAECESQVKGFQNPSFKRFSSAEEAQYWFIREPITVIPASNLVKEPSHHGQGNGVSVLQSPPVSEGGRDHSEMVNLESLSITVSELQSTVDRLLNVVESLSSELCATQETVARLESAIFIAPGGKRNFSTMTNQSDDKLGTKRPKLEKTATFTGTKFSDEEGVHVYTDGGCFGNGHSGARAGIGVFWGENNPDNVGEPLPGRPSNNRAEIHAAVRAVQIAKTRGVKNIILHTDSQFLINGITKWIKGWKRNGWKLSTGHPVINKDDFTALDKELSDISVKWVYVKGHSGDPGNDGADSLAKQGAALSKTSL